jgi:hypothetical protein
VTNSGPAVLPLIWSKGNATNGHPVAKTEEENDGVIDDPPRRFKLQRFPPIKASRMQRRQSRNCAVHQDCIGVTPTFYSART